MHLQVEEMSATTFIKEADIVTTLQSLNLVQYWRGQVRQRANPTATPPTVPTCWPACLTVLPGYRLTDLCLFVCD